jgi:hypothetical protein
MSPEGDDRMKIGDVPVLLYDQAPSNEAPPVLLLPGQPCPYCGEPPDSHEAVPSTRV